MLEPRWDPASIIPRNPHVLAAKNHGIRSPWRAGEATQLWKLNWWEITGKHLTAWWGDWYIPCAHWYWQHKLVLHAVCGIHLRNMWRQGSTEDVLPSTTNIIIYQLHRLCYSRKSRLRYSCYTRGDADFVIHHVNITLPRWSLNIVVITGSPTSVLSTWRKGAYP